MRRKPIAPSPITNDSLLTLEVLQRALQMLNQISGINRQLLDLVILAQRSEDKSKQILGELTSIKITIDNIEDNYKSRIAELKELSFMDSSHSDLRRLADRITDKVYRKNIFHQKYSKYLPNNILLHKQILECLKILNDRLEDGCLTNLLQLVQIISFMQYENILLYKHLIGIFVNNNVIESEEEVLRQVRKQKQVQSSSQSSISKQSSQNNDDQFDFNSYIQSSVIQMNKQRHRMVFEMPKPAKDRFTRSSRKSNDRTSKRKSSHRKINQQIQVQFEDNILQSQNGSSLQRIPTSLSKYSKKRQNLTQNEHDSSFSQLSYDSNKNLPQIKNQLPSKIVVAKKDPSLTKKYVLNKQYPKYVHSRNQNVSNSVQTTNKPVARIKLSMRDNYYFVTNQKNKPIQQQLTKNKNSKGKKLYKNLGGIVIKNQVIVDKNLKILPVANKTSSNKVVDHIFPKTVQNSIHYQQNHSNQNYAESNFAKYRLAISQCDNKILQSQELHQEFLSEDNNFCSTKVATPETNRVLTLKKSSSNNELSDVLICNAFNLHDSRKSIKSHIHKNKCNCKLMHVHSHSRQKIKTFLRNQLPIKQSKQNSCASFNFDDIIGFSRKHGKIKIPMYYKSGKMIKDKIDAKKSIECNHIPQSKIDLSSLRNSIIETTGPAKFKGSLLDRNSIKSSKRSTLFRQSKDMLFQFYEALKKELI